MTENINFNFKKLTSNQKKRKKKKRETKLIDQFHQYFLQR